MGRGLGRGRGGAPAASLYVLLALVALLASAGASTAAARQPLRLQRVLRAGAAARRCHHGLHRGHRLRAAARRGRGALGAAAAARPQEAHALGAGPLRALLRGRRRAPQRHGPRRQRRHAQLQGRHAAGQDGDVGAPARRSDAPAYRGRRHVLVGPAARPALPLPQRLASRDLAGDAARPGPLRVPGHHAPPAGQDRQPQGHGAGRADRGREHAPRVGALLQGGLRGGAHLPGGAVGGPRRHGALESGPAAPQRGRQHQRQHPKRQGGVHADAPPRPEEGLGELQLLGWQPGRHQRGRARAQRGAARRGARRQLRRHVEPRGDLAARPGAVQPTAGQRPVTVGLPAHGLRWVCRSAGEAGGPSTTR